MVACIRDVLRGVGQVLIPITFVFRCSRQWWLLCVIIVMVRHEASPSPLGCLLPQAVRHGRALCHLSRHISQGVEFFRRASS